MTEILLAEDEVAVREGLAVLLSHAGYAVRTVADGAAAVTEFTAKRPSLVLLDVMMPKLDGLAACAEIRRLDAEVPILFLTAKAGDTAEIEGLAVGADDFIAKTSSRAVLLARVTAALVRVHRHTDARTGDFVFGADKVDTARYRLIQGTGMEAELTLREIEMLRFFSQHPNEIFSRDFLLTKFWGQTFEGTDGTLSVAMKRLREKLGDTGKCLEAVYGCGYRFTPLGAKRQLAER